MSRKGTGGQGRGVGLDRPLPFQSQLLRSAFILESGQDFKKKAHSLFIDFVFLIMKESPTIHSWIMETMNAPRPHLRGDHYKV